MVLKAVSWTGVGVMALLIGASTTWANSGEDLARIMQKHGIRREVSLKVRPDLESVYNDAADRAAEDFEDCELKSLYEVRVPALRGKSVVGYEAYLECEDSPAVGIGLYYSVNHNFLTSLAYGQ